MCAMLDAGPFDLIALNFNLTSFIGQPKRAGFACPQLFFFLCLPFQNGIRDVTGRPSQKKNLAAINCTTPPPFEMAAKSNLGVACRPLASLQVNEIKRKKFPPPPFFFILDAVSIFRRLSGRSAATSKLFQQLMNFSFFFVGSLKRLSDGRKKKKVGRPMMTRLSG